MFNLNSNSDTWTGEKYETKEIAIQAALEEWKDRMEEGTAPVYRKIRIGQFKEYQPSISGESLIKQMSQQAYDECGEVSEPWISYITSSIGKELEEILNAAIKNWLKENKEYLNFGYVENIEKIDVSKFNNVLTSICR